MTKAAPQISLRTLAGQVTEDLAARIRFREIPPGERLQETALCAQYSVSRTVIREVLRKLEMLGLVDLEAWKGVRVTTFSRAEMAELYRILGATHRLVVESAIERRTPEQLARLVQAVGELDKLSKGSCTAKEFYLARVRANERLLECTGALHEFIQKRHVISRYEHQYVLTPYASKELRAKAAKGWRVLCKAIEGSDTASAVELVTGMMDEAVRLIVAELKM